MSERFAAAADLEARWRTLSDDEGRRADTLLGDASVFLAALMRKSGVGVAPGDSIQSETLKAVCCSMVQRAMSAATDSAPFSQESMAAGPFSQSYTYANPNGDMYLTKGERQRLGLDGQRMGSIRPHIGRSGYAW